MYEAKSVGLWKEKESGVKTWLASVFAACTLATDGTEKLSRGDERLDIV